MLAKLLTQNISKNIPTLTRLSVRSFAVLSAASEPAADPTIKGDSNIFKG